MKCLPEGSKSRIIARNGDKNKKSETEDNLDCSKLNEHNLSGVIFVSQNLCHVSAMDPSSIDMCFLLETVEEKKKESTRYVTLRNRLLTLVALRRPGGSGLLPPTATGMINDVDLNVALQPPTKQPASNSSVSHVLNRNQLLLVIESKNVENAVLKASSKLHEFHVCLGNLELDTTADTIRECIEVNMVFISLLHCEVVSSSRWHNARACGAHVIVDLLDKDTAHSPDS